jgi:hypothetical protein
MSGGPYSLVGELNAHDGPVRALARGPFDEVISGCQSNTPNVRRWAFSSDTVLEEIGSALPHNKWVTAVTSLAPGVLSIYAEVSSCRPTFSPSISVAAE